MIVIMIVIMIMIVIVITPITYHVSLITYHLSLITYPAPYHGPSPRPLGCPWDKGRVVGAGYRCCRRRAPKGWGSELKQLQSELANA